ncbi:MAG: TrkA family potassium uptake protein, partial [Bacillota bacterium]
DANVLKNIGIKNFDVVVVAIGENIQSNIMTTLLLKELGVQYVVAKALNKMHGRVLEKVGADRVVFPEREMGKRIAHNLVSANLVDYIELAQEFRISEIIAPREIHGKTLKNLNLRARYNVNVILLRRVSGEVICTPGAEDIIQPDDVLLMAGQKTELDKLERIWNK